MDAALQGDRRNLDDHVTAAADPSATGVEGGKWRLQRGSGSTSGDDALQDQKITPTWPRRGVTTAAIGPDPEGGITCCEPVDEGPRSATDRSCDQVTFAKAWAKC